MASETDPKEQLAILRASIDNFDAILVHTLAERFRKTKQVGELKATYDLAPSDPAREEEQLSRLRTLAKQSGLDPEFTEKFMAFVVKEVIRHHKIIRE